MSMKTSNAARLLSYHRPDPSRSANDPGGSSDEPESSARPNAATRSGASAGAPIGRGVKAALSGALALACLAACRSNSTSAPAPRAEDSLGSLRHARVAIERPTAKLTMFLGELTDAQREELTKLAPNVDLVSGLSRAQALERAGEAQAIDARFATREFIDAAPQLRWIQALSAGVDRYLPLAEQLEQRGIVMTNMQGAYGPAIADHVFAMVLSLSRDLRFYSEQQSKAQWTRGKPDGQPFALEGLTMLVVGLGGIGTDVAERAHGFGMRVIATRRSGSEGPNFVERVGKPDELLQLLPQADVVAICVPLTSETERLFDARAFAAMKPGAILVNIARGKVVDTQALLEALESGRLRGACLDVTEPEPLPADHPLWRTEGVLITPHVAADSKLSEERAWELLRENVRRFGAGEPLYNVVDLKAGY